MRLRLLEFDFEQQQHQKDTSGIAINCFMWGEYAQEIPQTQIEWIIEF